MSALNLAFAVGVAFALVVLALVPRLLKEQPPPRPLWRAVAFGIGMSLVFRLIIDLVRR